MCMLLMGGQCCRRRSYIGHLQASLRRKEYINENCYIIKRNLKEKGKSPSNFWFCLCSFFPECKTLQLTWTRPTKKSLELDEYLRIRGAGGDEQSLDSMSSTTNKHKEFSPAVTLKRKIAWSNQAFQSVSWWPPLRVYSSIFV